MGRLDTFLVERKLIPTRSRAKRAILCGLVKINGKVIQKPAYPIKVSDQVEILNELARKPVGYWKLHAILNLLDLNIFNSNDRVLDLGSSAGGFLEFAAERCQQVIGIEVSDEFAPVLRGLEEQYPNISILITDVFTIKPDEILGIEEVDIILNDLTLDPVNSVKILAKFLPFLKSKGFIIMAIKLGKNSFIKSKKYVKNAFNPLNLSILRILDIDPDKKEFHVIAQKQ